MKHSGYHVIRRPIISEKSTALAEVGGRYVFEVDKKATKQDIRQAVEKMFNVQVQKVRTMITHGKVKAFGRQWTKKPNWKKAIVTLGEGQKIEFFEASQAR